MKYTVKRDICYSKRSETRDLAYVIVPAGAEITPVDLNSLSPDDKEAFVNMAQEHKIKNSRLVVFMWDDKPRGIGMEELDVFGAKENIPWWRNQ